MMIFFCYRVKELPVFTTPLVFMLLLHYAQAPVTIVCANFFMHSL